MPDTQPLPRLTCPYCDGPLITIRRIGEYGAASQYDTVGNIVCAATNDCLGSWNYLGQPLTNRDGEGLVAVSSKVRYHLDSTAYERTAYLECADSWGNGWGVEKHTDEPVHLYWNGERWTEVTDD